VPCGYNLPVADNLLDRQFTVQEPNQAYVGDIAYIHTREGWLYLAVVIDLYSRQVVGWSMDGNMRAKLVNDALLMAIWKRKPDKGLLWHTDRGSQYASDSHRKPLKPYGIRQSMSRKGNCWDNAVSGSFFHTLKTELIHHQRFHSREEAKQAVFEYVEVFYNRERLHSANGYISPVDFEMQQNAA
jgi:putative transposase